MCAVGSSSTTRPSWLAGEASHPSSTPSCGTDRGAGHATRCPTALMARGYRLGGFGKGCRSRICLMPAPEGTFHAVLWPPSGVLEEVCSALRCSRCSCVRIARWRRSARACWAVGTRASRCMGSDGVNGSTSLGLSDWCAT